MKNIYKGIPQNLPDEFIELIAGEAQKGIIIERIVSRGHASPPDFWYDQDHDEFVILLKGKARILYKGKNHVFEMSSGDFLDIPAHTLHRVEWTSPDEDSVWLAVHYSP